MFRNILTTKPPLYYILLVSSMAMCGFAANRKTESALDKIKVEGRYISGIENSTSDIHIFKGVPFAAPLVDELLPFFISNKSKLKSIHDT